MVSDPCKDDKHDEYYSAGSHPSRRCFPKPTHHFSPTWIPPPWYSLIKVLPALNIFAHRSLGGYQRNLSAR
ncbi:hypothetical protein Moror_15630 [Moniliophthora roreri MCA 2997]|uniref:Uncharacterized protein n=1 Tax=Moniliophthora roreri (strain MCA 2997) TaxID=1381753 RepID=V2WS69_MONRO|nr:hypothetical protein Moror_15630 [Moniliophthora roreri MCA 2997]